MIIAIGNTVIIVLYEWLTQEGKVVQVAVENAIAAVRSLRERRAESSIDQEGM